MKDYHKREPERMSRTERDKRIVELRRQGYTLARIGREVGMSKNGVMQALRRVSDPGRYYERLDEEVDSPEPIKDDW